MNKVYNIYPKVKKLLKLYYKFKSILLNIKFTHALDWWIQKIYRINCGHINSFINGLTSDYEAIKNSIIQKESNGIVEASVNKLMLVKKIIYRKYSFELLRTKTLIMNVNR